MPLHIHIEGVQICKHYFNRLNAHVLLPTKQVRIYYLQGMLLKLHILTYFSEIICFIPLNY